jgi:uncharacterized LabA/DUF88 family protein
MNNQMALFMDFENIAIWAEEQFLDLDLDRLMEYLRGRGALVVKRAYGDWTRFSKYRDDLLGNSIDLIQMYSVRAGKNRADIRLALDAFEVATAHPQIGAIVIVSGDSDFGALASKLREYGRYILGIGPRGITHSLLVRSCDEFVYLETVLGLAPDLLTTQDSAQENARRLLLKALDRFGQRGELPVLGQALKQTMLSMDPSFNEENLGYARFRSWLEDNEDLIKLFFKGLQMYVAPVDFGIPQDFADAPRLETPPQPVPGLAVPAGLPAAYRRVFAKVVDTDPNTRRDVLRDIYRELSERPGYWNLGTLIDELQSRYESKGLERSKTFLRKISQLGFRQRAYQFVGDVSSASPITLAADIDSQAAFVRRAEAQYLYVVISYGLEIDRAELAALLLNDRTQTAYIEELLDDLQARGSIQGVGDQYRLPGLGENPLLSNLYLRPLIADLRSARIPENLGRDVAAARELDRQGMAARSQDFESAARDYLLASRILWDAFERRDPEATPELLRQMLASYASVKAGELSQVRQDYGAATPYYLAFFSLVQEDTPLWPRMRGLINPMLHFYWRNLGREMGMDLPYTTLPAELATTMARHPAPELRNRWQAATRTLAAINPDVLRRVADQIRLIQEDSENNCQIAAEIEGMIASNGAP